MRGLRLVVQGLLTYQQQVLETCSLLAQQTKGRLFVVLESVCLPVIKHLTCRQLLVAAERLLLPVPFLLLTTLLLPPDLASVLTPAGNVLLVKGAAECVLERCDRVMLPEGKVVKLTPALRSAILACVDDMADNALRILALARRCAGRVQGLGFMEACVAAG